MHWVSGKHVTCCDFAKVFHLYIIQFLKYRQTQVSSVCQVFVSLSHSLLALLCVASICFKRACLIICCIAPPTHPYKIFCQNIYNMDWCVVVYLPKKDRNNFQWNYSLPCHAPTKWQVPFETLQNGLLFLFSCFTCFKRSGLQTAQNIFASIYTFSVPPSCPYKVRGPRRNNYNMVWCFVISCAYSHIAEDTPREVL